MSDGAIYVVDTSALMDWHDRFYPPDVFPTLATLFDQLIAGGELLSAELVKDEIAANGSSGLQAWAKARKALFDPTRNHLAEALVIEGAYPALRDPNARFTEADAYVIAVARLHSGIVITAETPAATKRKARGRMYIPDVCSALGMPCFSILGMMRREAWKL